jgi:hypothetical protein
MDRREFVSVTALAGCARLSPGTLAKELPGQRLGAAEMIGQLRKEEGKAPIEGATWYSADAEGAGFVYRFAAGALAKAQYLVADMLLDGNVLATFSLTLHEGEKGRVFQYAFGGLNQCSFRVRMALDLVNQNRFFVGREGGLLKPMCLGDRVDLDKVDRMVFTLRRKGPQPVRWCMTSFHLAPGEVDRIAEPVLPKGALLDEFGQSALRDWPGKTRRVEELQVRIRKQYQDAPNQAWPEAFSRWGGWKAKKLREGAGFFRTHHDGRRWWLVDPDGYAFWSAGLDDVRVDCDARYDGLESALQWLPDPQGEFSAAYRGGGRGGSGVKSINYLYLVTNLIRALGPDGWRDKWAGIALAEMKRLRFNTVGNWSEWQYARDASFPYVKPMGFRGARTGTIYRDFADVFHPDFEKYAAEFASGLKDSTTDPACIGYFLMNEPAWGSSSELPAAGMLANTESCATRAELVRFLKTRYADDTALAAAWKRPASFDRIAAGKWTGVFPPEALNDLQEFSVRMVKRYFRTLSRACKQVDPNHLNLGMRWAGAPPAWAVEGMKFFDVFSLNRYNDRLPLEQARKIHDMLERPVMVGEFHFGALDVGLPASGIRHLKNQGDRAKAYRVYLEDAAADPYCVGAHWFTLYDESALGRSDGENYNIGFLDICNRAYDALGRAAMASHERMYQVADGRLQPFNERLDYLPKLFL